MNNSNSARHVGIGIALVSASMLMTEIILTRLFSVMIGFHFAFLAISVALFGIGAAALFLHLIQDRLPKERTDALLAYGSVALGAMIVVSDLALILAAPGGEGVHSTFAYKAVSTSYLLISFLAASAPFFAGGFVVSLAITRYTTRIHSLYFFDLVGAGAGCLLVIPALNLLGAPLALVAVAALASAGGLAFSRGNNARRSPIISWIVLAAMSVFILLAAINPASGLFAIRRAKGRDLEKAPVEFNRWNSFSMVTVIGDGPNRKRFRGWGLSRRYLGPFPEQKDLLIDMGAMTTLTRFDGDLTKLDHLMADLSAFAYHVRPEQTKEVCVLGAGGGRDVLTALAAGASHVTGVEINPLIVDGVVRGEFKEFAGGIYDRPDVTAIVDDGRGFIRGSDKKFDLIQISMIDTSAATAAGAYALTESNLYTMEAFDDYLSHLNPGGILTISAVSALIVEPGARIAAMAWHALRKIGADPASNVVAISTSYLNRKKNTIRNIMVKKEPFSANELRSIRKKATYYAFKKTYLPGKRVLPHNWIGRVLTAGSEEDLTRRTSRWRLDVSPTSDDKPFFFYQNHPKDAWVILGLEKARGKIATGLPVVLRVTLIALAMVAVFFAIPIAFARKQLGLGSGHAAWDLGYVACLGLGFMYVEIGLIQNFTLYLGFPTATLVVVLFVLLTAGAAGSRLFGRVKAADRRRQLAMAIGALVVLTIAVWQTGLAGALMNATCDWSLAGRAMLSAILLAPLGLLLGMPLPAGLFAVSSRAGSRIPWLWAINSATSVFGSVSAMVLSMHAGISGTLWVGAALYFLAMLISMRVMTPSGKSAR
ncbi:MAG: hypothetical protein GY854_14585 [Deltaproteobacteria bacterium]|nr:hypothetical protein [Deltaproteobacteria bacterium]